MEKKTGATTPWYNSRTLVAAAASLLSGVVPILDQAKLLELGLTDQQKGMLTIASMICGLMAVVLSRAAAEEAVKNLEGGNG